MNNPQSTNEDLRRQKTDTSKFLTTHQVSNNSLPSPSKRYLANNECSGMLNVTADHRLHQLNNFISENHCISSNLIYYETNKSYVFLFIYFVSFSYLNYNSSCITCIQLGLVTIKTSYVLP